MSANNRTCQLILVAFCLQSFVASAQQPSKIVRGTGGSSLWRGKDDVNKYFRFYSDGTVIGVYSIGTPADLERWFKAPFENSGNYTISGSSIHFSLTWGRSGTAVYDGAIQGDLLRLGKESYELIVPGSVETLPVLNGAFCEINVTNKTFRVVPRVGKTWKKDSARVFTWDDQTKLVSGTNTLTMAQFIGGKPLSETKSDVAALQGERGEFYIETVGGKEVVRMVEMMVQFDGESSSAPAMVGSSGARPLGSFGAGKVSCDDRK